MPAFKNTEIHYDIVGSFLRPEALKEAQQKFQAGQLSADELKRVQDEQISQLVQKEIESGLKFVTDGEFRRSWWHLDTFWGFDGIEKVKVPEGYHFHDTDTRPESARVTGKIRFNKNHPDLQAFAYLKKITTGEDVIARQSIPSPAQCYKELTRGEENTKALLDVYGTEEAAIKDIAQAYRELIQALYDEGCRDLKFDDCTWGMIVDQNFRKLTHVKDEDVKTLTEQFLSINNSVLESLPDDLAVSTHVCRGNYASTWAAAGGYGLVEDTLLAREKVQAFYLEFDTPRAGDFSPLEKVHDNQEVVLGLVSSKDPALEDEESLIKRVKEATQYHNLDKLSLSTQCGFASTEEGNKLSEAEQ
ncbi:5-methyltetrahydropteroyltriglutamate--homocysteine S-methyltransferase [Fructobacillus sp. CRL 2054]|uniref:5-methyltetrahydropteroyltriglutamate-- homocysteine S-methyltransferase n=1 Tax=Fructobacillus sp. CRL 2054 TaxID=2763007 RepID=UPI002377FAE9|nr:5-methyltetrahydropteroyltriglutamate--homocysteine S-methyltransferase [Fructobacillus sp. CRL 2054]MDD9139125.1 5-methyltetrahydropteroyltriglutamate--homocysteine S-methyltransferase [Fructobacillus sp. CRL 2054]